MHLCVHVCVCACTRVCVCVCVCIDFLEMSFKLKKQCGFFSGIWQWERVLVSSVAKGRMGAGLALALPVLSSVHVSEMVCIFPNLTILQYTGHIGLLPALITSF